MAPMRSASLRTRLVATVVGLLLAGLVLTGGATFGALQDWRARQSDDLLALASREVATTLTDAAGGPGPEVTGLRAAVGEASALWRTLAERGDVPAHFQLRDGRGRVLETVTFGTGPAVPAVLPDDLRPAAPAPDDPLGARFVRLAGGPGSGEVHWRLRSARLSEASSDILLVAQRSTASDELIDRTANVMVGTSLAVLVGLTLLSGLLVRRGLRPLEDIGATATAIGEGDLTRRIVDTSERTEVGRLGRALNAMLGQIERAFAEQTRSEERLRRFVGDASHELRTPIATVRGYAELFRRGAAQRPGDLADAMHRIEAEAVRMGDLVDELLLLARLDQGRPLEDEPVDLGALVTEVVNATTAVDPDRLIGLQVEGSHRVSGDAVRLRQVVANLLANVRAHTPAGAPAEVRVSGSVEQVELTVTDSGPGLSEADRERVFERFYQADRPSVPHPDRDGGQGGAGLGLAIVAAVVAAHGGHVGVEPAPGGGCVFRVRLPARDAAQYAEMRR